MYRQRIIELKREGSIMFDLCFQLAFENLLLFGLHLEHRNMFPKQLSRKAEAEYIEKMAEGDTEARNKLIEHNLRLVAYIVNKNYPDYNDQDDLISIGTIGLIRAVETFDCSKGNLFSTYASRCIDNAITHLRKHRVFTHSAARMSHLSFTCFWRRVTQTCQLMFRFAKIITII